MNVSLRYGWLSVLRRGGCSSSILSVTPLVMDLLVAAPAQTHEVTLIMRSAFREGNDVMHLFHRNVASSLEAHLT